MNNKVKALALVGLCALSLHQPAEAGILKKVGHIVKKTVMLPVYFVGGATAGALTGTVLWYYVGGKEGDLKRALSGGR